MSHFPGSHTVSRFKHLSQNKPPAIFSASWQQKWAHARHITPTFIYLHPEVPALKHIHMCEQCHQHNCRQHQIARTAAQMKRHAKQRQRINRKQPFFNRIHLFRLYFFGSIESDMKIRKSLPQNKSIVSASPRHPVKKNSISIRILLP